MFKYWIVFEGGEQKEYMFDTDDIDEVNKIVDKVFGEDKITIVSKCT